MQNAVHDDDEIQRVCGLLEKVAEQYGPDSEEAGALRDAALAFTVVVQQANLRNAYNKLRQACEGQLTEPILQDLRRHGIAPEDFAD